MRVVNVGRASQRTTKRRAEAFNRCYALHSIALPNTLQSIDKEAFNDCPALTSVALPDGLQTVGRNAFGYLGERGDRRRVPNFTLRGAPGSVAEEYARKNKFRFKSR